MDDDPREHPTPDDLDADDYDGDSDDESAPTRWERRRRLTRAVSIVALLALIVPGALATWALARSTAASACRLAVDVRVDARTPARVAFELDALETLGWNCYALAPTGEVRIAVLGVIPGAPDLRPRSGS